MSKGPFLFVANSGGHIDELVRLADRLTTGERPIFWLTPETTQTSALLAGRNVQFVPSVGPRQMRKAVAALPEAIRIIRRLDASHVVSTGAALAAPYMIAARLLGRPFTFIESAARQESPSATGRLSEFLPGVDRRTQAPVAFNRRWMACGSVLDGYESYERAIPKNPVRQVVLSLGGERFAFPRAVQRAREIIPPNVRITWQVGSTLASGLGPESAWVEPTALRAAMREADAVLIHAGVGSALAALDAGKFPILLVRRRTHGEHVDDHQEQLARALSERNLGVAPTLESLTWNTVTYAASMSVRRNPDAGAIPIEKQ